MYHFGGYLVLLFGRQAGFPFVVVFCLLFFVGNTWASSVSHYLLTKKPTANSTSYHCNPCRGQSRL